MTRKHGPPEPTANPLAGVLDRLLARERGEQAATPPRTAQRPGRRDVAAAATPSARRMLVVAGIGADDGRAALRSAGQWAARLGLRPAVVELGWETAPAGEDPEQSSASRTGARIPVARIPCGPERLQEEPPEVVAALMERLRRHEAASDLLLVRTRGRFRMALMRAAFLAGGMVVPLDASDETLDDAFRVSREALESFLDLKVWPFAGDAKSLERYLDMMRDFLKARPVRFDPDGLDLGTVLRTLPEPPEEGFLTALLAPGSPAPPSELIQIDSMPL